MQAVILCAGKSTRTHPLTVNKPKPLLKIANETILEHNLKQLNGLVDEVILVIGFCKEQMKQFAESIKNNYEFKISFVEQKELLGTGHAVQVCKDKINSRFIALNGDDLYGRKDIENCLKHRYCNLVAKVKFPKRFGTIKYKGNRLVSIHEKSDKPPSELVNTGLFVLNKSIFDFPVGKTERGEIELTDMVNEVAKKETFNYERASEWLPVSYPWHVLEANEFLLQKLKPEIKGKIEKNATIKGNVSIGKGTLVKNGAYIEGPVLIGEKCEIGPNCYIRACTSIGNNCKVGNAVEIKNSVLMDSVKVGHLSYIGDSIIGEGTNIGAGTITANLRHDNQNVYTMVKAQKTDTGRKKFGAIIGENVHTGINTSIYPGRKIWPEKTTLPGEVVRKDIN